MDGVEKTERDGVEVTTITLEGPRADIAAYVAADGAWVVQIDTCDMTGPVRVYLNDGLLYRGDPEKDPGPVWVPVVGVAR